MIYIFILSSGWLTAKNSSVVASSSVRPKAESTEKSETEVLEKRELYEKLLKERSEIADELNCMPYMVAPNATLMTISRVKPTDLQDLRRLNRKINFSCQI